MRRLSSSFPRRQVNGIELVVVSPELADKAQLFFSRTAEALESASAGAASMYTALGKDVQRVILWEGKVTSFYHQFQLAVLVPPEVAFGADKLCYAAWLLYVSGLARSKRHALARLEKFLSSLGLAERSRIEEWMSRALGNRVLRGP